MKIDAVLNDEGLVHVVNPGGQPSLVSQQELRTALEQGFAPMTPEQVDQQRLEQERGTLGQQALTAGETALSTATLGLSDVAGAHLSPEWKQATRERRQVNPNVALAGEIAGVVAPALASGGTSLAARGVGAVGAPMRALGAVGSAVETGAARALGVGAESVFARAAQRGLTMAASGAVEGGVFEVTRGVVDSVLGDTEYTAEKLTADLKKGVKWGAIGGGVVGVGSTLVSAAGKRAVDSMLQGKSMQEGLKDFAEKRAASSAAGSLQDIAGRENRIGRKLLDADIPLNRSKAAESAIRRQADNAADDLMTAAKRLDQSGARLPVQDIAKRLDDRLKTLRAGSFGDQAKEVESVARALERVREAPSWRGAVRVRNRLDKLLRKTDDETLLTLRNTIDNSLTESLELTDEAMHAAVARDPEIFTAVLAEQAAAKEAAGKALEDLSDWGALGRVKRGVDKSGGIVGDAGDVLTGLAFLKALAMGGVGGLPGMAVAAGAGAARKLARNYVMERGSGWLARVADAVHKADTRVNRAIGRITHANTKAAAQKGSGAIAGEPDWVGSLAEQAISGGAPATPAPSGPVVRRAAQLGNYVERYKQLQEQVRAFRDPKESVSILEAATGELAATHPEVAEAVHRQVLADAAYIESQLPTGSQLDLSPLAPRAPANKYDQLLALDIADALNDPPAVLEALASGRLNVDQWRALQERRPRMFAEWQQRVMQDTIANIDKIPLQQRVLIGTAFQFPADWSMLPENVAAIQATGLPPEETAAPTGGPSLDPASAEQYTTPSQVAVGG